MARLFFVCLGLLLSGCTVGPDYQAPKPKLPNAWLEAKTAANPSELTRWWQGFNDARLNKWVTQALQGNLDLKAAQMRLKAARAQRELSHAQSWPSINASTAYQRQRISPNALLGALGSIQDGQSSSGDLLSSLGSIGTPFDLFQAGFDSSWELDLFGGIKRQQQVADANADAIVENQHAIQVTLTAEVVTTYLQLTALQARLNIVNERLQNQQELYRFSKASFEQGLATALDVQQTQAELDAIASTLPTLNSEIKNTRYALTLLLGLTPGSLDQELTTIPGTVPTPPMIQPGLPSELLRRRPDIRQAERSLAAASASIGAAVAELFPKLSLTGVAGFQSQDLSNFTNLSSGFYGFGPRLSLPIFQAGRLLANIDTQNARYEEALVTYNKTVLTALTEVENSLASLQGKHSQQLLLAQTEHSTRQAAETAKAYYQEGETDWQNVLRSRSAWYDTREQRLQSQLAWTTQHVALVKALGGGW